MMNLYYQGYLWDHLVPCTMHSIRTSAVVVGKPLLNIGTIADNMKLLRPNEFGTANDVLLANTGGISTSDVQHLDSRFGKN